MPPPAVPGAGKPKLALLSLYDPRIDGGPACGGTSFATSQAAETKPLLMPRTPKRLTRPTIRSEIGVADRVICATDRTYVILSCWSISVGSCIEVNGYA